MAKPIAEEAAASLRLALRAPEAARALGISERSLWSLTHEGDVPHFRIGTSIIYPIDALRRWLDQHAEANDGNENREMK